MAAAKQKPDQKAADQASAALKEALDQAEPKDGEQPEAEKPARKPVKKLALNEIEGEVKDGEKIRIGVQVWGGPNAGSTINAPFVVPEKWEIAGPTSRPDWIHAINPDTPDRTLCRLSTAWVKGRTDYPDGTYITCEPCSRRLIAVGKLDPKKHEAARTAARESAAKALADRKAAEQKAKDEAKAKKEAEAKVKEAAPERASATEAKPDPKPKRTRRKSGEQKAA